MTSPEPVPVVVPVVTEPVPPTQVRHPWRTTVRSIIQNLPTIALVITVIVQAAQDNNVGWVEVWGPSALAVSAVLTRVSAYPGVNALLTRIGIGATPKTVTPDPYQKT